MSDLQNSDIQRINIHSLYCDGANPRFRNHVESGREAVREMFKKHLAEQLDLAEDIAKFGLMPFQAIYVREDRSGGDGHPPRYIVLEGNRRIAAIKALHAPEIVEDRLGASQLSQLRQWAIQNAANIPTEIPCVVAHDLQMSYKWLSQRHVTGKGGLGTIPWASIEQERFDRDKLSIPSPTLELLEKVIQYGEMNRALNTHEDKFQYSNLKRLWQNPLIRRVLGVDEVKSKRHKEIKWLGPLEQVIPAWDHIVHLIATDEDFSVNDIRNKKDQARFVQDKCGHLLPEVSRMNDEYKEYYDEFKTFLEQKKIVLPASEDTQAGLPLIPHSASEGMKESNGTSTKGDASVPGPTAQSATTLSVVAAEKSSPDKAQRSRPTFRKTLIPKELELTISNARIARIYRELQELWLYYYPNAIVNLFRTFLELTVNELQSIAKIYEPPDNQNQNSWDKKKLADKIERAIAYLAENNYLDKGQKTAVSYISRENHRVIDILHQCVHSAHIHPDDHHLRQIWDNTQHLFVAVWNKVPRPEGR